MNCYRCLRTIAENERYYQVALAEHTPGAAAVPLYDVGQLCAPCVDKRTAHRLRLDLPKKPVGRLSKAAPKAKRTKRKKKQSNK